MERFSVERVFSEELDFVRSSRSKEFSTSCVSGVSTVRPGRCSGVDNN